MGRRKIRLKNICPDCGGTMGPGNRRYIYPVIGENNFVGENVCRRCAPIRIQELKEAGILVESDRQPLEVFND